MGGGVFYPAGGASWLAQSFYDGGGSGFLVVVASTTLLEASILSRARAGLSVVGGARHPAGGAFSRAALVGMLWFESASTI